MAAQGQHSGDAQGHDESGPEVWGLWNGHLRDWFNPGTRKPYFATRAAAERMVPLAQRQYARGVWAVHPYPRNVALAGSITDPPDGAIPG